MQVELILIIPEKYQHEKCIAWTTFDIDWGTRNVGYGELDFLNWQKLVQSGHDSSRIMFMDGLKTLGSILIDSSFHPSDVG